MTKQKNKCYNVTNEVLKMTLESALIVPRKGKLQKINKYANVYLKIVNEPNMCTVGKLSHFRLSSEKIFFYK